MAIPEPVEGTPRTLASTSSASVHCQLPYSFYRPVYLLFRREVRKTETHGPLLPRPQGLAQQKNAASFWRASNTTRAAPSEPSCAPPGTVPEACERLQDRLAHAGRLPHRRRGIVQVDHDVLLLYRVPPSNPARGSYSCAGNSRDCSSQGGDRRP